MKSKTQLAILSLTFVAFPSAVFSMSFEEATGIAQSAFTGAGTLENPDFSQLDTNASIISLNYENLITTNFGGNTYYKAVSIMSENTWSSYYSSFAGTTTTKTNSAGYESWITFATTDTNSLLGYMKSNIEEYQFTAEGAAGRAETLLGMPAAGTHTIVAEFWISADSIFRPAINWNPESDEIQTTWDTSAKAGPDWFKATYGKTYSKWFETNADGNTYPWTGLGYTFDYDDSNTEKEEWVGLSEFIIAADKGFYVISGTPILAYIPEPSLFSIFAGTLVLAMVATRRRRAFKN